jgi:transposase, IS5 family
MPSSAMEDSLYDSESMRRLAQIELQDDAVPEETTILRFAICSSSTS